MSQTLWCSPGSLRSVIDQIAPEFRWRGCDGTVEQLYAAINDVALARSLEQRCFKEIHSGPWDQIWNRWRTVYSISLLVQIFYHTGSQRQLLQLIDKALIFGDELCRRNLTTYAGTIQWRFLREITTSMANVFCGLVNVHSEQISQRLASEFEQTPVYIDDEISCEVSHISHWPSLAKAVIRLQTCDPFRFHRDFVSMGVPVVIEGLIKSWPSFNIRTFKNTTYLKKKMGFRTVIIESGTNYQSDPNWSPLLMTIGEFIDSTILPEKKTVPVLYLAQNDLIEQVPELAADISAPDYIEFDPTNENVDSDPRVRTTIWFGPAGTVSPLHTDPEDNILCQVFGHKYVRLYTDSPEFRAEKDGGGIAKQPYYQTTLHPGDALLIPKGMWHHVESLSKSFSVNFWWSRNPVSSPSSL